MSAAAAGLLALEEHEVDVLALGAEAAAAPHPAVLVLVPALPATPPARLRSHRQQPPDNCWAGFNRPNS